MGNVFTDELTLKEGDLLSMLSFGDYYTDQVYKQELNSWIQRGYQVIVPSRLLEYKNWNDIGFIARSPEKYNWGQISTLDKFINWIKIDIWQGHYVYNMLKPKHMVYTLERGWE